MVRIFGLKNIKLVKLIYRYLNKGGKTGGFVTLKVFDVLGNEIETLVNEHKPAGSYEIEFSATSSESKLTSGIYIYQLSAGSYSATKKMLMIK